MLRNKKKVQIAGAFASLLLFAVVVGCNGFFVDPTLTALAIGPQASIQQGNTVQMQAVGTYDDGSQKSVSSVFWSSSDVSVATISTGGLVTGVSPGDATISGSSGAVSGSTTVTVTLSGLTKITVSPITDTITDGDSVTYTATGTAHGQTYDVTDQVNWTVSNTSVAQIDSTGDLTTLGVVTSQTTITVTARDPSTGISGTAQLTINPAQ